jgi:iron-sulfur cluster assembly accessory protein
MQVVNLTNAAALKVKQLIERDGRADHSLRLKVVSGGCSGLQYQMMFDDQLDEDDLLSEQHGVRVVVDSKSADLLSGTSIDYVDGLDDSGFKIDNPRASESCGCGESFSAG